MEDPALPYSPNNELRILASMASPVLRSTMVEKLKTLVLTGDEPTRLIITAVFLINPELGRPARSKFGGSLRGCSSGSMAQEVRVLTASPYTTITVAQHSL